MNFIDFHVHIDFFDKPELILHEYEMTRTYAIFVTNLPELFHIHYQKIRGYKYVRLALGFHPEIVSQFPFQKELFNEYVKLTNYIGEVGLDLSTKSKKYADKQIEAFEYITTHPDSKVKVLSIHSKGAEKEVLHTLKKNQVKYAVFHWYSGDKSLIPEICDAGYYFSINPRMIQTEKGKNIVRSIPVDRMLFETDGPFIKYNGSLMNPAQIPSAYKEVEKFLNISDLKSLVYNNFRHLILQANLSRLANNDLQFNNVNKE